MAFCLKSEEVALINLYISAIYRSRRNLVLNFTHEMLYILIEGLNFLLISPSLYGISNHH